MARPMPVLPEVGSMMVPPGLSFPVFSASSTIESAMRSLIEPPGFARSLFTHTSLEPKRRLRRITGVLPMVARMVGAFMDALRDKDRQGYPIGRCAAPRDRQAHSRHRRK